jgi:hypothetical protein
VLPSTVKEELGSFKKCQEKLPKLKSKGKRELKRQNRESKSGGHAQNI